MNTESAAQNDAVLPLWVIKRTQGTEDDSVSSLPQGFPYSIDELSGQVFEPGLLFLATTQIRRDGWFQKNTVDAYASDLLDWTRYLTRRRVPWNKATWEDLALYVSSMDRFVSPHHGRHYTERTKTRRLVPITAMYKWAPQHIPALCEHSPYGTLFDARKAAEFLDERRKSRRSRVPVGRDDADEEEIPLYMNEGEVKETLKAMGPEPRAPGCDEDEESAASSIGHLGMELGLQAGLRVSEVVGLRVRLFKRYLDQELIPGAFYRVGKFRRKGGDRKSVRMHGVLVQKVVNYIKRERAEVMRGVQVDHGVLLVHKTGKHRGEPLCTGTLQRRFEPHRESRRPVGVSQTTISDSASWR